MNYPSHRAETIAVVLVTHNNERTLERALESVHWADEIVVIDQGSTDETLTIARQYTQKVFFHPSRNPVTLKNYGIAQANQDWILYVEPYEWVEDRLRHEIDGVLLNTGPDVDGYYIPRKLYFMGQWLKRGRLYPHAQLRLFRRERGEAIDHVFFDQIQVPSTHNNLAHPLGSEPYANLQALFNMVNEKSTRSAYQVLEQEGFGKAGEGKFKRSLLNLLLRAKYTFINRYLIGLGCLEGSGGFTLALAQACQNFLKYAKYRALTGQF